MARGRGSARSAAGERDRRRASGSSANDKHLCLVSVIGVERPDKSHWKRRLARERLTGNSYQAGRLNAGAEVYIWSYIQSKFA